MQSATPFKQGLAVLSVGLSSILIVGLLSSNEEIEWFLATVSLGFFAWMNAVLSFFRREKWLQYVGQSILVFLVIAFTTLLSAHLLASVPIKREYILMFAITSVFYSCSMTIAAMIRKVAEFVGINY